MVRTWIKYVGTSVEMFLRRQFERFGSFLTKRRFLRHYPRTHKMVMVSFLGIVDVFSWYVAWRVSPDMKMTYSFDNPAAYVPVAKAEEIEESKEIEKPLSERLTDYIYLHESSNGKNNYSKCEAIGKVNRYGFGIPGDGTYLCFDGDDDRKAAEGWVVQRIAEGRSPKSLLCRYNVGSWSEACPYAEEWE